MSFQTDIKRFTDKAVKNSERESRSVKIALFSGVVMGTRVLSGRLRGNWQCSASAPIKTTIERVDLSGGAVTAEIEGSVTSTGVDFLSNNLPYAARWDEVDGNIARNMQLVLANANKR